MTKLILIAIAFTLMGFVGCEPEKVSVPTVDWCTTTYAADEASCVADIKCQWKADKAKCADAKK